MSHLKELDKFRKQMIEDIDLKLAKKLDKDDNTIYCLRDYMNKKLDYDYINNKKKEDQTFGQIWWSNVINYNYDSIPQCRKCYNDYLQYMNDPSPTFMENCSPYCIWWDYFHIKRREIDKKEVIKNELNEQKKKEELQNKKEEEIELMKKELKKEKEKEKEMTKNKIGKEFNKNKDKITKELKK
jgi:hypothetical protein